MKFNDQFLTSCQSDFKFTYDFKKHDNENALLIDSICFNAFYEISTQHDWKMLTKKFDEIINHCDEKFDIKIRWQNRH